MCILYAVIIFCTHPVTIKVISKSINLAHMHALVKMARGEIFLGLFVILSMSNHGVWFSEQQRCHHLDALSIAKNRWNTVSSSSFLIKLPSLTLMIKLKWLDIWEPIIYIRSFKVQKATQASCQRSFKYRTMLKVISKAKLSLVKE